MEHRHRLESLLRAVHTYQVDASTEGVLAAGGKVRIDEISFLEQLYVTRDAELEARLLKQVDLRQNVICVFGERGCGKTSLLRSMRAQLAAVGKRVLLIDLKVLWDQIVSLAREPVEEATIPQLEVIFSRVLRDALLRQLWPSVEERDKMHAWLLAGPDGDDLSRFTTLDEVISEARLLGRVVSAPSHVARAKAILEIIQNTPAEVRSLVRSLLNVVSAGQLARCFARMNPNTDLVVIYDNIDRIPASAPQNTFLRLVNDFQLAASPLVASVVGIRPENLRAAGARPNQAGDIWSIRFLESSWPGFGLLQAETAHLQSILRKRHEFFSLVAADEDADEEASSTFLASEGRLHHQLLSEIARESLLLLVNGNLRAANSLYADFLPFLLALEARFPEHFEAALEHGRTENHLQTLMYYWIRECGAANDIPVHDFERDAVATGKRASIGAASLEHLVMTATLNLHHDSERLPEDGWHGWPAIRTVTGRVRQLGYRPVDIEAAIDGLAGDPGEPGEVLSVETARAGRNPRVKLTRAGRHLLLEVYNRVGFIWAPAMRWHATKRGGTPREYFELSTNERVDVLSEYFEMRAKRHLQLMQFVRDRLGGGGAKWLQRYRQWFGVGHSLQIERLLRSASHFYAWYFDRPQADTFSRILAIYNICLREIETDAATKRWDVSKLWNRNAKAYQSGQRR